MKGASLFFLDTLMPDPQGRGLVTSPSLSPENQHPFGAALCAGPAMDRQILRDLFDRTIDAGRRLGRDPALLDQFASARRSLAPDRVGKLGQLQEWLEDWDAEAPEQQHRHVSHLYAVYPSHQLNVRDTPAMIRAAEVSLDRRGDRSTGWATAWRLCLWARMGDARAGALHPARAARARAHLSQPVRRAPPVPDRRQFRRRGRDPGNAGAKLGRRAHPSARAAGGMAGGFGEGNARARRADRGPALGWREGPQPPRPRPAGDELRAEGGRKPRSSQPRCEGSIFAHEVTVAPAATIPIVRQLGDAILRSTGRQSA